MNVETSILIEDEAGNEVERNVTFEATWEPPDRSVGIMSGCWLIEGANFEDGTPVPETLIEVYEDEWRELARAEDEGAADYSADMSIDEARERRHGI